MPALLGAQQYKSPFNAGVSVGSASAWAYQHLVADVSISSAHICTGDTPSSPPSLTLADVDYCVMHSPFVKMVRKGFARIFYQDHLRAKIRQSARQVLPLV